MPTVQQKYIMSGNAKCKPFSRNTQYSGSQNANRPAEMKSPGQPSRILKSSVPYHSATVTGRGLAEEDDFEVVRGAAIDADTHLGYHHRSLGDRRRMLKKYILGYDNGRINRAPLVSSSFMRLDLGV